MTAARDRQETSCVDAMELVDAYALGALESDEAAALQQHVSDCANCRAELGKSHRTAALLALSVRIENAPPRLRERILASANRETYRIPIWQRLLPSRRTSTRALAFGGVAALAFAVFVQAELTNLRGDKDQLQEQLSAASSELQQQRQIVAVLSADDTEKVAMEPMSAKSQAMSVYNWSPDNAAGFIVCRDFPDLAAGRVYELWFVNGGYAEPVATFLPQSGNCQIPMDMSRLNWRPNAVGISVEPWGGSRSPSRPWFSYASFNEAYATGSSSVEPSMEIAALGP